MQQFVKAMYDAWRNGQEDECASRYKVFITLACKHLHRSEEEMERYLKSQPWFKYPKELL